MVVANYHFCFALLSPSPTVLFESKKPPMPVDQKLSHSTEALENGSKKVVAPDLRPKMNGTPKDDLYIIKGLNTYKLIPNPFLKLCMIICTVISHINVILSHMIIYSLWDMYTPLMISQIMVPWYYYTIVFHNI